jgi:anti-sigma factor RsiW
MSKQCDIPIESYHDGELSVAQREEVERHLAGCPACADRLEQLRAMSAAFAAVERPKLSQIAAARLQRQVEELIRGGRGERERMRIVWRCAAAAACIVLAGSVWLSQTPKPAEAAPPWLEITAVTDADPAIRQASSPAAQWYLASAWTPSDAGGNQ